MTYRSIIILKLLDLVNITKSFYHGMNRTIRNSCDMYKYANKPEPIHSRLLSTCNNRCLSLGCINIFKIVRYNLPINLYKCTNLYYLFAFQKYFEWCSSLLQLYLCVSFVCVIIGSQDVIVIERQMILIHCCTNVFSFVKNIILYLRSLLLKCLLTCV